MEFVVSRAKTFRRLLPPSVFMLVWIGSLDLAMAWTARLVPMAWPHWATGGFAVAWLLAVAANLCIRHRLQARAGMLQIDGRELCVTGPVFFSVSDPRGQLWRRRLLVVTTESGPVYFDDIYDRPLEEIRDALGPQPPVPSGGELHEYGTRWHLSCGWMIPALWGFAALWFALKFKFRPPPSDAVLPALGSWFAALFAWPWLWLTIADPSRRFERWARITPDYLLFSNDGLIVVPTRAVADVRAVFGTVLVYCRNGAVVRFPDASLERALNLACGLDPASMIRFPTPPRKSG